MQTTSRVIDHSREMDEKAWWDLWNSSYRAQDDNDEVSCALFARVSRVVNQLAKGTSGHVLEIACGTGTLSRLLNYSSYHGLDISPAAIDIAVKKAQGLQFSPGVEPPTYEAADFHDWRMPQRKFDVVVCVDAISCFRYPGLVFEKIVQCLPVDGSLVLTTINPFVYYRIKRVWENGPVSHWYSRRELHALVESSGLRISASYTIMPRGKLGILRLINAGRLNEAFGPRFAAFLRHRKEQVGLGQYRVVVARKTASLSPPARGKIRGNPPGKNG